MGVPAISLDKLSMKPFMIIRNMYDIENYYMVQFLGENERYEASQ